MIMLFRESYNRLTANALSDKAKFDAQAVTISKVTLPDGTVLVTGGTTGGGFVDIDPSHAAKAAELWDPKTPTQWRTLASNSVMRVYHSVSLLQAVE